MLNSPGAAANFSTAADYDWLLAEATSTISAYTAQDQFIVDTTAFANTFFGTFSVLRGDSVSGGNDMQLYLVYEGAEFVRARAEHVCPGPAGPRRPGALRPAAAAAVEPVDLSRPFKTASSFLGRT